MQSEDGKAVGTLEELPSGNEVARRIGLLLRRFPRGDGEPWRPSEIEVATDYGVSSSYFSALKTGKFKRPGIKQLSLIADAMGFPFKLWLTDPEDWDGVPDSRPPEPLTEILELAPRERAVLRAVRQLDAAGQEAVLVLARQLAVRQVEA